MDKQENIYFSLRNVAAFLCHKPLSLAKCPQRVRARSTSTNNNFTCLGTAFAMVLSIIALKNEDSKHYSTYIVYVESVVRERSVC